MPRVFLSIGSNLGDRLECLRQAIERLGALPKVRFVDASPLYRTEPWELQPGQHADPETWFLNCVAVIETALEPVTLLQRLQEVETSLGRRRGPGPLEAQRYEPRTVDIDILFYGDQVISGPDDLHIPHLLLHERRFVLRPLVDLAPELEHPVLYETVSELLAELEDEHEVLPSGLPPRWFER
ncbi:MAG TPA: 2-amino-4-hydroxy-6-hydroxymethyldihydropteridine diphosphokinase [Methylomirabilota bacterium]|nr:2-amino-4-hydroxy-6-hydroxymethyldihydropteridine diphosphokinase [Methylomirabilota bacterium]